MNSIKNLGKMECCGCSACYCVCPTRSITMVEHKDGFFYPEINEEMCVMCGKCVKVCPILTTPINSKIPESYIMRVKDEDTLLDSTSGGMFTPLAKKVINSNGVVYGARYDDNYDVVHYGTSAMDEIHLFRGSKYVKSNINETYLSVESDLRCEKTVLFSGTPCQVAGLKNYLQREYSNLYCVDLVCHGGPSPKVFRAYLDYLTNKYKANISKINFRKKVYGYHSSAMQVDFCNGKSYIASGRVDYMLLSFFFGLCSRESCYNCHFRCKSRVSDLTLFDAWHYSALTGKADDDKGYTHVFVQSDKGKEMIEWIRSEIEIEKVDLESAIRYDGIMICEQPERNKNRDTFITLVDSKGIDYAVKKNINKIFLRKAIERTRGFLYRIGVLKMIKQWKFR